MSTLMGRRTRDRACMTAGMLALESTFDADFSPQRYAFHVGEKRPAGTQTRGSPI
jgi:hypothetical protein